MMVLRRRSGRHFTNWANSDDLGLEAVRFSKLTPGRALHLSLSNSFQQQLNLPLTLSSSDHYLTETMVNRL